MQPLNPNKFDEGNLIQSHTTKRRSLTKHNSRSIATFSTTIFPAKSNLSVPSKTLIGRAAAGKQHSTQDFYDSIFLTCVEMNVVYTPLIIWSMRYPLGGNGPWVLGGIMRGVIGMDTLWRMAETMRERGDGSMPVPPQQGNISLL